MQDLGNNSFDELTIGKEGNMGSLPECDGITIDFDCQFKVHLKDSRISTILAVFAVLLPQLLMDFFQKVLVGFGEYAMSLKTKPFVCKCGNDR
jgi:hypothetical protein